MDLKEKIKNKKANIAVIGLGYVGLPKAVEIAKSGFSVTGIDLDKEKVKKVNDNISYLDDVSKENLKEAKEKGGLKATTDYKVLKNIDIVLICVPTPLTKNKAPKTDYIKQAGKAISKQLNSKKLIILESTTYPGTTQEELKPILENNKRKAGQDFFLAFSPERINPGSKVPLSKVPKVIGAISKKGTDIAKTFYKQIVEKVHTVSSPKTAEMTKLLENTYRLVNISMINELALLAGKLDIDIWEVIEAAKTKPYGFKAFYPSPKIGGHCIPLDPFYLSWKAREKNFWARFIEDAGRVNEQMPHFVVTRVFTALNKKGIALSKSKILVWGVSYKKDIGDARESAALEIIPDLLRKKAKTDYFDPHIPKLEIKHKYLDKPTILKSINYTPKILKNYDLVLILTAHSDFDYEKIAKNANLVVDTRNAIKKRDYKNVFRL